ncbi:MAG: TiaS agmantine-binding domain-containing protein [Candidatus Syntropharchaeia archaeon]
MEELHIGIDDTDSPYKGCTTYIGAIVVENFLELGIKFIDYPNLVRLNPNVPWKTRGNGAVALHVIGKKDDLKEIVIDAVMKNSDLDFSGTDPGICFLSGKIPERVKDFYRKALLGIVTIEEAESIVKSENIEIIKIKEGRGIIGAIAAIGADFDDYTYELLSYRIPDNYGKKRRINRDSVFLADKITYPETFGTVDLETGRIICTPHSPCPVFFGIRGNNIQAVKKAMEIIKPEEPIERWVIYRTNQATDCHMVRKKIGEISPRMSVVITGTVCRDPVTIQGGHVIFSIEDSTGRADCAAYEPTGNLRKVVRELRTGDVVEVYGGVRSTQHGITINLEKIRIIGLKEILEKKNPKCECGKSMKSMGRGQGYRCKRCGKKVPKSHEKIEIKKRNIEKGLYTVPPRSMRHLSKPIERYGRENSGKSPVISPFYGRDRFK